MDELTENLQKLNLLRAQFDQNKDLQTPPKKSQVGPGEWHFANFFCFCFCRNKEFDDYFVFSAVPPKPKKVSARLTLTFCSE